MPDLGSIAASFPTALLLVQLLVGLAAAVDLVRTMVRRRFGLFVAGQVLMAAMLIPLGLDGLFLQSDIVGQVTYAIGMDPALVRPAQIGLIVVGAILWGLDR